MDNNEQPEKRGRKGLSRVGAVFIAIAIFVVGFLAGW